MIIQTLNPVTLTSCVKNQLHLNNLSKSIVSQTHRVTADPVEQKKLKTYERST